VFELTKISVGRKNNILEGAKEILNAQNKLVSNIKVYGFSSVDSLLTSST